jgi:methyl-accepting chemotaxis protein
MASLREYLAGLNAIDANGEALPTRESYAEALGGSGVLGTRKPVENLDAHLLQIGKAWSTFRSQSRVVALDKTIFVTAATAVERFNQATNELKETLTTDEDAPVLLVRLVESIREKTLSGPQDFKDAVDVANLYLTSLERAFPNGVPASIAQKNGAWITQLGRVLNARSERFNPVILANAIGADAKRLSNRLTVLEQETLALTPQGSIAIFLATVAGVLALAALAGVGVSVAAQQAVTADEDLRRSREEKEKSDALQREFIGLIEEMAVIADGNLTVQVNANRESDVSSLAFMINTMADQLRPALAAAGRVAKSMQESVGTAVAMASRSQQSQQRQIETAQQIARIATDIQESIRKVEEVATSTAEISADAERAVEVGSEAQQRVREGLDAVREGAFTNNKRARALAESVTGIVDSYQLIREVAQQTYVIALNTSLLGAQLTGEEGNHIRVLGDRVSDLARSIRDREPELRASLSRILNETAELSASLEQAEALVNKATDESRLSEAAIDNMLKLTKSVSELTQKNAAEVGAQRAQADVLLSSSQAVGSTAQEAATAVQQTVEQIKPLVGQAQEMDKQLSQFKVA